MKLLLLFYSGSLYRAHSLFKGGMYIFLFLFTATVFSQDLTVTATVTPETCPGNGALQLAAQNAAPAPPVNYQVFLLPNTTNAIWDSSNPNVSGLTGGNYLIVAAQTVGGVTQTDEIEVEIEDQTVPLEYSITSFNAMCGNDGLILVQNISGTAVTYEILSGPLTFPPQASNQFPNVPAGFYNIRVTDGCGTGIVTAHTVFSSGPVLTLTPGFFPDMQLPGCDLITVGNNIVATTDVDIAYPLTLNYTVYPPNGADPIYYTQTLTGGNPDTQMLEQVIPFYYDTDYYYDLVVTDPCGVEYTSLNNLVRQIFQTSAGFEIAECSGYFLMITLSKYVGPYEITFITVPEGFIPEEFNAGHPGPYFGDQTNYGDMENPIPFGIYEYSITDACGRTATFETEIEEPEELEPEFTATNTDCNGGLGRVEIRLPSLYIEFGYITSSPPEYEHADELPYDVSEYVDDLGRLQVSGLAPGIYIFTVIDTCGTEFIIEIEIPEYSSATIAALTRPDCEPGKGTVRIVGYEFSSVIMIEAPAGTSVPQDVSFNLNDNGQFIMDGLEPGNYVFATESDCGGPQDVAATIIGYEVQSSDISHTPYCGSFDLSVFHDSNGAGLSLWLQRLVDEDTDTWGHPEFGAPYPEGTIPNATNSMELENNEIVYGLTYTGEFRVIKRFRAFGSGSTQDDKECIEVIHEFSYYDDLNLIDIISLTCSGENADVQINVEGVSPITFEIISKNGESFYIDNGTDNVFTNLESAIYQVFFQDPCGNYRTETFNVAELPSLVSSGTPEDLEACDMDDDNSETFDLSVQNNEILNGQDPSLVSITYHASLQDAEDAAAPLPLSFTTGSTTIYARVTLIANTECYVISQFDIILRDNPVLVMQDAYAICEGETLTVTAPGGYAGYEWSTDSTNQSVIITEGGNYTVTVTDTYGCSDSHTFTVTTSSPPVIQTVDTSDWTESNNIITVVLEDSPHTVNFEYSIDGITYQDSNTFTGLEPGEYEVYVRDKFNCGNDADIAYLLTYPKFFTPNGDGINETWRIEFSAIEPNMKVFVYDRYGKLITGFGSNSAGWDGTYNGQRLFAADYWFVVIRENGQELKGHFSLIR